MALCLFYNFDQTCRRIAAMTAVSLAPSGKGA